MNFKTGKILDTCMKMLRGMMRSVVPCAAACGDCCRWSSWAFMREEKISVPSDVPKGHMVVYVGECRRRFVIKVTLLKHPLFQALLDQAREVYDFTAADSRLCIPCDVNIFLSVVQCAKSPLNRHTCSCL